jgi:hypothetical protein
MKINCQLSLGFFCRALGRFFDRRLHLGVDLTRVQVTLYPKVDRDSYRDQSHGTND